MEKSYNPYQQNEFTLLKSVVTTLLVIILFVVVKILGVTVWIVQSFWVLSLFYVFALFLQAVSIEEVSGEIK